MVNLNGNVLSVMQHFIQMVRQEHGIGRPAKLSVREYEAVSKPKKLKEMMPGGTQEEIQEILKQMNGFESLEELNKWPSGFESINLKQELRAVFKAYNAAQVGGELFSLSNDNQAACSALLKRLKSMNKYQKTEIGSFEGTDFDVAGFYKELEKMFYDQFQVKDGAVAAEMSSKTAAALSESQGLAGELQSDLSPENALILLQDRAY